MRSTPTPAADLARAAVAAFRVGAGQTLAAWPVLAGRCLFYVLLLVVLSALWDKVAAERLPGTLASTLPPGGFALYIGVTEWITLALPAIHLRLEDDIRGGGLEPHLLRPKPYLVQRLSQAAGEMTVRMTALGATALAVLALSGRAPPPPGTFAVLPLLGALAAIVGLLLYTLAGLAAFWARRTMPFQLVIQKLMFLLGGLFAPISLYPAWLRRIGEASPFSAHLYWAGVQALHPSAAQAVRGLGWQLVWVVVLGLACAALWRAGLAKALREGAV